MFKLNMGLFYLMFLILLPLKYWDIIPIDWVWVVGPLWIPILIYGILALMTLIVYYSIRKPPNEKR